MRISTVLLAALLGALLASCLPPSTVPPDDGGVFGCTGVCSTDGGSTPSDGGAVVAADGGQDAGRALCEGVELGADAGELSLEALRALPLCGQHVRVSGVRVVAVDRVLLGTNTHVNANAVDFWVASPAGDAGFFVRKAYEDDPRLLALDAGDVVSLDGYLQQVPAVTADDGLNDRPFLGAVALPQDAGALTISWQGAGPPVERLELDAGSFGDALGGTVAPDPELAGLPLRVRGPVEVLRWDPPALSVETAAGARFRGFELEGGVLVVDDKVRGSCDLRALADAGALTIEGGVAGIWDTLSHGPCVGVDAFGTWCGVKDAGTVPGAPGTRFTYALYVQGCADLDGGS